MKKSITLLLILLAAVMPFRSTAANNDTHIKKLLIINSYNEDEMWANRMMQPVETLIAKIDSVDCDHVFLNNSFVTDMDTYNTICDNIFDRYADQHPSCVVLLGNFAFSLRDRIKAEWGDIPFLLVSRVETYAPTEQYFAPKEDYSLLEENNQLPLGRVRKDYNFTAVIVPDCYSDCLDLISALIPDIENLVFMSDKSYVNKLAAINLEAMLQEKMPGVKFHWLQASEERRNDVVELLVRQHSKTTVTLVSSWVYEVENLRGEHVLTTRDLMLIPEAVNPVFSIRSVYSKMGCIGGAFANNDEVANKIGEYVVAMINGDDMRKKPFYVPEEVEVVVDYNKMKEFDLDFDALPKDAIVFNRPLGYLEQYWMLLVAVFVAFAVAVFVVSYRNRVQKRQIDLLERHSFFLNSLPLPYTKAVLWLDDEQNVVNIKYDTKNVAYENLITQNSLSDNPLHLFSNSYLSDIVHEMLSTHESVKVRHHFKRTDSYCYFIFVPVLTQKKTSKKSSEAQKTFEVDVFAIDITNDHRLQQRLKDQAVTIDISMEMAQLVPWQWDAETDTISFYSYRSNSSGDSTLDPQQRSLMKVEEFLHKLAPEDVETVIRYINSILRGDASRLDMEFRMHREESGEDYVWCENHGVVTDTDSDGRPMRVTGSLQYITERKEQEEIMKEALTKAKESDMLKSAFLANMSHEIRTPLNAIVGFSNLLTTTDNPQERAEFTDIINANNELLLNLINDILDLAKIESNTITITKDTCDIHDLVSSISKTISIRVPKGVKLNVVHYADSCVVKADAAHISQILINFLTNATKFTKRGSITVGYEVCEAENKIYFYVKDTGMGISKENIDKVFDRFIKLNNFVQGNGLGLAICRTLVEKMEGEIGVESPGEGRGCKFWFTVPFDPEDLKLESNDVVQDIVENERVIEKHPSKLDKPASFNFKTPSDISNNALESVPDGLTVLVAEDNESNYKLMSRLIKNKFRLFHAENGRIALDMLNEVQPDIIVMDINMPEMDGYQSVEEMRKRGVDVPIIAVTAYAFASDRIKILNSGFDAFVSKPVSATILYETIVDVWERKKLKKRD